MKVKNAAMNAKSYNSELHDENINFKKINVIKEQICSPSSKFAPKEQAIF
jgi:hypothetical protein